MRMNESSEGHGGSPVKVLQKMSPQESVAAQDVAAKLN